MTPRHDVRLSHANGMTRVSLSSLVGLTGADPESRTTWIHVAPFGSWDGHSEGSFALTRDYFASVVAQLSGKRTPVSLDYEHASIRPNGEPTPAAGYALAGEIRGDGSSPEDGLYALVEFTKRAADFIRSGEYRFCSGVFVFDSPDGESGNAIPCALDTIALTNRPFIDGQKPIVLSRSIPLTAGAPMVIDLKVLQKALDALPGENTAEKVKMVIDLLAKDDKPADIAPAAETVDASKPKPVVALTDPAPAVALAPEAPVAAADPAPMPMAVDGATSDAGEEDVDAKLMAATGLDEAGLGAAILANFDAIVQVLMGDPSQMAATAALSKTVWAAERTELVKELNAFRAEAAKREEIALAAEVDSHIGRKFMPGQRASMLALARANPKEFRAFAASQPDLAIFKPHASGLEAPAGESESKMVPLAKTHPRYIETEKMLTASGLPKATVEKHLAALTG